MNVFPSREFANTLQRVGRISRVQKNKTYAISYDFIYWSPTFFSQFYSPNNTHRYKAYKETCEMPDYMNEFIKYGCSTFYGKESNALDKLPFLKQNEKFAFIDLDKI